MHFLLKEQSQVPRTIDLPCFAAVYNYYNCDEIITVNELFEL